MLARFCRRGLAKFAKKINWQIQNRAAEHRFVGKLVASQVRKYTSGRLIVDWLITACKAKLDAAITQDRMAAEPLRQKHLGQDEGCP